MAPRITILSLGEEVAIGLGQKTNLSKVYIFNDSYMFNWCISFSSW